MSYLRVTMSAIVDDNSRAVDPEAEVRKLQDLVKKLEQQNQILRNKQTPQLDQDGNLLNSQTDNHKTRTSKNINGAQTENIRDNVTNNTLDDVELLDVENLDLEDDEDNWLYESPKKPSPAQRSVDPYAWAREEFEHPSPEIETVKRSLLFKLEEVSNRVSRSSSAGTLGSILSPLSGDEQNRMPGHSNHSASSPNLRNGPLSLSPAQRNGSMEPAETPKSTGMPNIRRPIPVPGLGTRVDTGTFTRSRKNKIGLGTGTIKLKQKPGDDLQRPVIDDQVDGDDVDDSGTCSFQVGATDEEENIEPVAAADSISQSQQKLDVHALAKLQEESLRQSFTSGSSPRKNLSKSMNRSGFGFGALDSGSSPENSARSSPGRYDGDVYEASSRSNNSLASPSSQSSLGSPPDSPHSSNQHLDRKPHHFMETRRSLPNLARMAHPQGLQPLTRRSGESPKRDSSLGRNVTRQPGSGARQASPARAMSPQRSGIPAPRSSIPRPGSATRLPTPKKSGIPAAPRRSLTPRTMDDDSWKDGCF